MTKEKPPYNLGNFIKVYKNKKAWQKNVQPSMRLLLILFVTVVFVEIFLGYGFVLLLASIYAFVFSLYLYFPNTRPWFHRIFRIKNPPEVLFSFPWTFSQRMFVPMQFGLFLFMFYFGLKIIGDAGFCGQYLFLC
jgi:hypothetical protein